MALVRFGCIDIALRVHRYAMDSIKLARLPSAVAKARQDLQRVAIENVDFLVFPITKINVLLLRVSRKRNVPNRACAECSFGDESFFDESAVRPEYLNPIVHAIAHVQQV